VLLTIIERIKLSFPPSPNWRFEQQTTPPTLGWAKRVNEKRLDAEVAKRRDRCLEIIKDSRKYCDFIDGKVAVVVLSCKRWRTLERLIKSMQSFFSSIDGYRPLERVLVDNGSGDELMGKAKAARFFDRIVAHPKNLGMAGALRDIFPELDAEYILLLEDDFVLDYDRPFLERCIRLLKEFPEIGIIRLKNQNNWWKPHRVIAPLRRTSDGTEFWTWLSSRDGTLNGWAAGSVLFRKVSYMSTGELPLVDANLPRRKKMHQGYVYECVYGKEYNKTWLAAKIKDVCPFVQPNDSQASEGWGG
jgi:hypothetical protein